MPDRLSCCDTQEFFTFAKCTPFDTFSSSAHIAQASGAVQVRRLLLKRLLEAEGFVNHNQEWRHYTMSVPNPVRFARVIH